MDPYYNWTIRVVPHLSVSWNYSLWWLIYGGLTIFGGLLYLAICLCVLQLSWMFMCQLFVMWHSTMWSTLTYMFQTYILNHFATTSPSFSIISIYNALPIVCGCFKPLMDLFGYQLVLLCLLVSLHNSAIYNLALASAGGAAIIIFGHLSTSTKHILIKRIIKLRLMELWTSLQTAILAFIQLVTSAASCHNSRTENDSLVNYWPRHLILIINFTWNGLQICGFTSNLAISNFPIFSMVNKPTWIFFDYITSWTTNNPSNNLLYLVWFGNHRERASQILFVNNYAPTGPTRNEISWARFS